MKRELTKLQQKRYSRFW